MSQEMIEHVSKGYANAQDTIRFIDQKNAFVSGLSTALAGVALAIIGKIIGRPEEQFNSAIMTPNCGHWLAFGLIVISCAIAAACLINVVLSVRASAPRSDRGVEHSILFPYVVSPKDLTAFNSSYTAYAKKLEDGFDVSYILREYADQLAIVGWILSVKREYHRASVALFAWQMGTLTTGVIIGLLWSI